MKKTKVLFTICAVGIASLIISCSNAPSQNQIIPISAIPEDPGENPEDNGENPEDPGENPGDNGENPEDNGETTPENNPIEYQFHETVEYLPAGTDGSAGTTGTYVLFGDWPQTIKAQNVEIDTTRTMTRGGFTFYLGSDRSLYIQCEENAYGRGYTYSDGTVVAQQSSHSTKYFKVEPIKWRVLNPTPAEGEKKMLLAEQSLTAYIPFFDTYTSRTLNNETIYQNNYKYSNIRAYLNGIPNQFLTDGGTDDGRNYNIDWTGIGFLQRAFTTAAINKISDTLVKNDSQSTANNQNPYVCEDTTDKIFLLSFQEMINTAYGFDTGSNTNDEKRIRVPTDYAKANNRSCDISGTYNSNFLRSPHYQSTQYVTVVKNDGTIRLDLLGRKCLGIVPALCLKE